MSRKLLYTNEPTIRDAYTEDTYSCLARVDYGLLFAGVIVGILLLVF